MKKLAFLVIVASLCLFDASAKKIKKEAGQALVYGTIEYNFAKGNKKFEGMPKTLKATRGLSLTFVSLNGNASFKISADSKGEILSAAVRPGLYRLSEVRYDRDSLFYSWTDPGQYRDDMIISVEEGKVTNLSHLNYSYNYQYNNGLVTVSEDYDETKAHFDKIYKDSE